jgi:hypothetical protein
MLAKRVSEVKSLKILTSQDSHELKLFLQNHCESSVRLLANAATAGLEDGGGEQEGTYAARWEAKTIVSLAAHYQNGVVVLQAPEVPGDLVRLASLSSKRPLVGIQGPWAQVQRALYELKIGAAASWVTTKPDTVFALDLNKLTVPAVFPQDQVNCRPLREEDQELIVRWRAAWKMESRRHLSCSQPTSWVLEYQGRLVSLVEMGARWANIVQLEGVYTSPELRCRGWARVAIAKVLMLAKAEAVQKAVFTVGSQMMAAHSLCRALGFKEVGEEGVVLFASASRLSI